MSSGALASLAEPFRLTDELAAYAPLLRRLAEGVTVGEDSSRLVDEALAVWARPGFDTFMCLGRLRFEPFPYQLETAARVLRQMQGRAILADEVGLGKTIEAGLVLSELRLRGLADRALILVPAGLVDQWREELELKFGLPAHIPAAGARDLDGARSGGIVLASLAAARRAPLRDAIARPSWDLVIVDEAHRLKNQRSASARLARSLRARYMLLLTATPVENRLSDLFSLVSLLRPGSLGTASEFRTRHAARGDGRVARNIVELQRSLRDVMVRHRRSELKTMLPRRLAETVRVEPAPAETELYRLVSERVRHAAREQRPGGLLALRGVQRAAGSSAGALAPSLTRLGWPDLAARAAEVGVTGKVRALLAILDRHRERGEKVVVFTAFRATLELLGEHVARHGLAAVTYHGGLPRAQKDAAIAAFRDEAPILLSTEAAGEGRNLQFCHVMVNFDLPWNPMQIEQRLGRIHRIGQEHDVMLTNLVARDTIEERILEVLQAKINLFELVVGELDMILGRVEEDLDFELLVFDRFVSSRDDAEFAQSLTAIGDEL
ncbi:MAG: hypothetical protein QOE44_1640, partial [Solirubrobacteraceae bacterium]|nr:hypothetical protein [Solirubrobacteraceae bacterium]